MQQIRLKVPRNELHGGRDAHGLAFPTALRLSPNTDDSGGAKETMPPQSHNDPHRPRVAQANMVSGAAGTLHPAPPTPPAASRSPVYQRGKVVSPGTSNPAASRMAPERLEFGHLQLPEPCMKILASARADSTKKTYTAKWTRFCNWCASNNLHPVLCHTHEILPYMLQLAKSGLQHASIRVHLSAITVHRKRPGAPSTFSEPVMKRFLRGLLRTFPPVRRPPPAWNLNLVLAQLMRPPFEPIHRADLRALTLKTAFLVAITSARRVSEIQALCSHEPYLRFHPDKVVLRTHPKFIPKVPSAYHLNAPIILPVFFPDPKTEAEKALHTLDPARTLKYYLQATEPHRHSKRLLLAYGDKTKGQAVTKQTIARWITDCIRTCYTKANKPLPGRVTAHSTRGKAATAAMFANTPLVDICNAATWRSPHTFTRHYCLDSDARAESRVGQAALKTLFN